MADMGTGQAPDTTPVPGPVTNALAPTISAVAPNTPAANAATNASSTAEQDMFSNFIGNIGKISAQVGNAFAIGQAAGGAAAASAAKADSIGNASNAASLQAGQDQAAIILNQKQAETEAAKSLAAQAIQLKLDPGNVATEIGQFNDAQTKAIGAAQSIDKMKQTGFFDNPVAYIMNNLVGIPVAKQQLDRSVGIAGLISDDVSKRYEMLNNLAPADLAINSDKLTQKAATFADIAIQNAKVAGLDSQMKALQTQISAYNLGIAGSEAQSRAASVGIEASTAQGHLLLERDQAGYYTAAKSAAIQEQLARATELQAVTKKSTDQESAIDLVNKTINDFLPTVGVAAKVDVRGLSRKQADALEMLSLNSQTTGGSLAGDPVTAVQLFHEAGLSPNNLPDGQKLTIDTIDKLTAEGVAKFSNPANTGGVKLSGQELATTVNSYVKQSLLNFQGNISSNTPLYAPPSLNVMLQQDWAKNNSLLQAMKPLTINGAGSPVVHQTDFKEFFDTAADLVDKGKLTEDQAVKNIQDIAKNSLNDVQTAGGYKRWAIPVQESYNTIIKNGSSHTAVDLFNPAQVQVMLRTAGAEQRTYKLLKENPTALMVP